jgi:hypothetical protein
LKRIFIILYGWRWFQIFENFIFECDILNLCK